MKIYESISDPLKVKLPNGIEKSVRLKFGLYKILSDKDAKELIEVFARGVEFYLVKDYVITKEVSPMKVEI